MVLLRDGLRFPAVARDDGHELGVVDVGERGEHGATRDVSESDHGESNLFGRHVISSSR